MILGNALWLWMLAAIIVPIGVHLWNRKSGEPQLLGTFRFLPDQSFAKARRLELHEVPLLILRIILIGLIVLLLADLLIEREQPNIESVIISETNSAEWSEINQDGIVEIEISSLDIEQMGWWALLKQIDTEYQPTIIHVNGRISQQFFHGTRPSIAADITWEPIESEMNIPSPIWQSSDDNYSSLSQQRDSLGIFHSIEQISNPESVDSLADVSSLRILINSEIPQQIQNGIEFAAAYWNASTEFTELSESTLLTIITNDQEFSLQQITQEDGVVDRVEASAQTGVNTEFSNLDSSSVHPSEIFLETERNRIPVFGFEDGQTAFVNGNIASGLTAWFYAGVAHKLIQNSLGIDQFLSPAMPQELRQTGESEQQMAGIFVNESMRVWLIILLLIIWAGERILAPGRGM